MRDGDGEFVLGIECSNPGAGDSSVVAVARRGADGALELLGERGLEGDGRGSDGLVASAAALCAGHGVDARMIGRIAVSVGPGGYTALRTSVTAAKVLARAVGAELVGVETARVVAVSVGDEARPALILLASKREKSHASVLRADGGIDPLGVVDAGVFDDAARAGVKTVVGDGHVHASLVDAARARGIGWAAPVLSAWACLRASEGLAGARGAAIAGVGVVYAREPDAVTQWRARHGGHGGGSSR